jgi:uncharacterized membrane protein
MIKCNSMLKAVLGGAIALSATVVTSTAFAADEHEGMEQCAGVVKAGKNDCATAKNACHGHVESNSDPMAWIYVPKGTCERIVGAHLVKVTDPTPKKS